MNDFWLLTENGILNKDGKQVENSPFQGKRVTTGDNLNGNIAVIIDEKELWTCDSWKGDWIHQVDSMTKMNCVLWTPEKRLLIGTAGARLLWFNGGEVDFIQSFDEVKERSLWDTPWGGPPDVRSLAKSCDSRILYVNVHAGWIVRSKDDGKTWECKKQGLEKDVHHVSTHPKNPNIVFTATAKGFHISFNKGDQFIRRWEKINQNYQRTTLCFPDENIYLASVADNWNGGHSRLYRSENDGVTWQEVQGLPLGQNNINTFQLAALRDGYELTLLENSKLFQSQDFGISWRKISIDLPKTYQILPID